MSNHEIRQIATLLAELWPSHGLSEAEMSLYIDQIKNFQFADANNTIRAHKLQSDYQRPDLAKCINGMRLRNQSHVANTRKAQGKRSIDSLRRAYEKNTGKCLDTMGDVELAIRHGHGLWKEAVKPLRDVDFANITKDMQGEFSRRISERETRICDEMIELLVDECNITPEHAAQMWTVASTGNDYRFSELLREWVDYLGTGSQVAEEVAAL